MVIEIGSAAGWIHDLAVTMGLEIQVANPNHEAWRWKNVKRKTDKDDALKLAQLSAMNQLPTLQLPSTEVRQWRSLIGYRNTLVARRPAGFDNTIEINAIAGPGCVLQDPPATKRWRRPSKSTAGA